MIAYGRFRNLPVIDGDKYVRRASCGASVVVIPWSCTAVRGAAGF
jgi:hypothetical protein